MSNYRGSYNRSNSNQDSRVPNDPPYVAYVGQLPTRLIQGDIEQIFKNQKVKSVRMMRDRETDDFRGQAFVEFHDRNSLVDALMLNGAMLEDRNIRVDVAEDKRKGDRNSERGDRNGPPSRGNYGNDRGGDSRSYNRPTSDMGRGMSRGGSGGGRGNYSDSYGSQRSRDDDRPSSYSSASSGRGGGRGYGNDFNSDRRGPGGYDNRRSGGSSNGNSYDSYNSGFGGQQQRFSNNGYRGSGRDYQSNDRGYGGGGRDGGRGGYSQHRGGRGADRLNDDFSDMKIADPADAANRPKLVLAPRTVPIPLNTLAEASERTRSIFGDAKPRDAKDDVESSSGGRKSESENGSTAAQSS